MLHNKRILLGITGSIAAYKSALLARELQRRGAEVRVVMSKAATEFITPTDSLEEVFENREQIEISRFYERLPKPHSIAIAELGQDLIGINDVVEGEEAEEAADADA